MCLSKASSRLAQLVERRTFNPVVVGSSPTVGKICLFIYSRLAQLVERKTLNLVVVGSSPTVGKFSYSLVG